MSKKCKQCGCELADDALFCVQCGAKQDPVVKCPKCGHMNPAANDFCTECGTRLKETKPEEKGAGDEKPAESVQPAQEETSKVVVAEPVSGGQGGGGNQGFQNFRMPPVPPEGNGKKKKILAIIGVLVVVLGLFFAFGGGSKPIQVKSSEIVDDYIRDQSSGDKKYKDKTVQVSGKVKWKGQFNNSQNYSITLESRKNGGKTYQVLVDVPAKRASIVNDLKIGDFVNVKGKCVGIVKQKSPTLISVQIKSTKINDQDAD
ncbi:double zinc ribbon domain-containing protein [uncultured Acidaminococcus sp.]|uniref:double zinc ribbon domain-containing protein n=1 Tax=uncultured Acidaminococcus sp. TaxID=352152 RepID=UPI00258B3950|nr:zinc ribbon domain-containing protein [uncultured Acidaminococcus sp.]